MSVKLSIWGTAGRIFADRQECKVYLRDGMQPAMGYSKGWNVRYTTDLTETVWFYVRGEEYSAQIDYFVKAIASGATENVNSFAAAAQTDQLMSMMRDDAQGRSIGAVNVSIQPTKKEAVVSPVRRREGQWK